MQKTLNRFKEKWIWKTPVPGPHRYRSVDDLHKSLAEKDAFLQEAVMNMYYSLRRIKEWPGDAFRDIKWKHQRAFRGYSDCDVWGMHNHLSIIISGMLKDLRKNHMGYPTNMLPRRKNCEWTADEEKSAEDCWNEIIDDMIYTFDTCEKISEHDWMYPANWIDYTSRELKIKDKYISTSSLRDIHWMTKDEINRYNRGWEYFRKYYFNLWD